MKNIQFLLSGGPSNTDPKKSTGGPAATCVIGNGVSNLFNSIEDEKNNAIDYRCFYLFNGGTKVIRGIRGYIESQSDPGSIEMGIKRSTEIQSVVIVGNPKDDFFSMRYNNRKFSIKYDPDISQWALNFQNSIRRIPSLENVSVTSKKDGKNRNFTIVFDENRGHNLLRIISSKLGKVSIKVIRENNGSPVNTIADRLAVPTVSPAHVVFGVPYEQYPIIVGDMFPGDLAPIWVKRKPVAGGERRKEFVFKIISN